MEGGNFYNPPIVQYVVKSNMRLTGKNFLYQGINGKKYTFYHLETCGEGHCFVHAVLALTVAGYHDSSEDKKKKMAETMRKMVASTVDDDSKYPYIFDEMIEIEDGDFPRSNKDRLKENILVQNIATGTPVGFFSHYIERNIVVLTKNFGHGKQKPDNLSSTLKYKKEWPTIFIYADGEHYEALLFKNVGSKTCREDDNYSCVMEKGEKNVPYLTK